MIEIGFENGSNKGSSKNLIIKLKDDKDSNTLKLPDLRPDSKHDSK